MAEVNQALPKLTPAQLAPIQQRVYVELAKANATQNPYAYWASQPWFPPGYTVTKQGKVTRTAPTDSRGNWFMRNVLAKPQVMLPAVLGGGYALGSLLGGAAAGTGAAASGATAPAVAETTLAGMTPNALAASLGSAGATAGATAGAAATGSGSWISNALGMAANAIPAVAGLTGAGQAKSASPEAQALIDQQRARMDASTPLYEAVLKLAMSRMPTNATQGLSVPSYDAANASLPAVGADNNYNEDPATRALLRTQLVRSKMSDPLQQALLRLAQSRMPTSFGGG